VDSAGDTIEFLLSGKRNAVAAKRFLQKELRSPGHPRRRVIDIDRNPSYPKAMSELRRTGISVADVDVDSVRCLNNVVEQDLRAIKRQLRACQGFRSFPAAQRTIQGIETMNMLRKGQVRWIAKSGIAVQAMFVEDILGLTSR
jgi:transposase, IS6 family